MKVIVRCLQNKNTCTSMMKPENYSMMPALHLNYGRDKLICPLYVHRKKFPATTKNPNSAKVNFHHTRNKVWDVLVI